MRRISALLVLAAASILAFVSARRWIRVAVEGDSMAPTLADGDWLLAARPGRLRRGDVVVVRPPGRGMDMVKRIVGVPGDEGLGPGRYLVVGDNPMRSTDGRSFGPVGRGDILAVVRFRYWPRPGLVR